MVMDRAYEGDATRQLASGLGYSVVVPPRKSRKVPWEYDEELYKRRNEVERLFRRMKGFRRIFTRYDKLDELYIGFILFGTIFDALRSVKQALVCGGHGVTELATVDLPDRRGLPTHEHDHNEADSADQQQR